MCFAVSNPYKVKFAGSLTGRWIDAYLPLISLIVFFAAAMHKRKFIADTIFLFKN
jgi:hypothetical protein